MTHFGFLSHSQLQGVKFQADLVHRQHPTGLFMVHTQKAYGYRQSLLSYICNTLEASTIAAVLPETVGG